MKSEKMNTLAFTSLRMKTDFGRCFEVISSIVWLQVEGLTSGSELPALSELTATLLSRGPFKDLVYSYCTTLLISIDRITFITSLTLQKETA